VSGNRIFPADTCWSKPGHVCPASHAASTPVATGPQVKRTRCVLVVRCALRMRAVARTAPPCLGRGGMSRSPRGSCCIWACATCLRGRRGRGARVCTAVPIAAIEAKLRHAPHEPVCELTGHTAPPGKELTVPASIVRHPFAVAGWTRAPAGAGVPLSVQTAIPGPLACPDPREHQALCPAGSGASRWACRHRQP
jgi:hypothetical protein